MVAQYPTECRSNDTMTNRGGGQIDQIGKGRTRHDEWAYLTDYKATENEPVPDVPIYPEHKAKYTTKLEQSAGASRDKAVRDNAGALLNMDKTAYEAAMQRPAATAEPVEPTRDEGDTDEAWTVIKEGYRQQKAQHEAEMKVNKAKIVQIEAYEAVDKHFAAHFVGAAASVMGRHRIEVTHGAKGTRMFAAALDRLQVRKGAAAHS